MVKTKKLQICYHGTPTKIIAKKIMKEGFKIGTFFAKHLEDAIGFGGVHIFQIEFESAKLPKGCWQFISSDVIPPSKIVEHSTYPKKTVHYKNHVLGAKIFESNLTIKDGKIQK